MYDVSHSGIGSENSSADFRNSHGSIIMGEPLLSPLDTYWIALRSNLGGWFGNMKALLIMLPCYMIR